MPKHRPCPACPSSPVMKPRVMVADNDPGYPPEVAFQVYPREEDRCRDDLTPIPVLVLDMSPAGQEWLVEEVDAIITRGINKWLAGGGDNACEAVPRAILARLLSAQRPKGGKGR